MNRRLELKKAAWQLGAYAAMALVVAISLVALSVSYASNRAYLAEVATDVANAACACRSLAPGASIEGVLPRLNAVRAVSDSANRYQDEHAVGHALVAVSRRLGRQFRARVPICASWTASCCRRLAARIKQRLDEYATEPEQLYIYLKAYLMLGEPQHLDKKHLQDLADAEWDAPNRCPAAAPRSRRTSGACSSTATRCDRSPMDPTVVARARSTLRPDVDPADPVRPAAASATPAINAAPSASTSSRLGIEKVMRRKSGRRLSEPVPALYTKEVFKEITAAGVLPS